MKELTMAICKKKKPVCKTGEYGNKFWYLKGLLHREDGPACEYVCGDKFWYLNGLLHRVDGPALECANGIKLWYLNDTEYSETEYYERLRNGNL